MRRAVANSSRIVLDADRAHWDPADLSRVQTAVSVCAQNQAFHPQAVGEVVGEWECQAGTGTWRDTDSEVATLACNIYIYIYIYISIYLYIY